MGTSPLQIDLQAGGLRISITSRNSATPPSRSQAQRTHYFFGDCSNCLLDGPSPRTLSRVNHGPYAELTKGIPWVSGQHAVRVTALRSEAPK